MEKITDFINRTNPNKKVTLVETQVSKNDNETKKQPEDSFEKSNTPINNKKRNIIITSVIGAIALAVAFFKRKDISNALSNLFKKQPKINPEIPEIKPVENLPVDKIVSKSSFEIQGLSEKMTNEMQKALDSLTIRADDKELNCGVGFIGENLEKREEAMNVFINKLVENEYEVIKVPTIDEASPDEIAIGLYNSIQNAQEKFRKIGKRSLLVIRDMDIIADSGDKGIKYNDIASTIKYHVENCKEKGFAWVWDAKKFENIEQPIGLKRTRYKIFV